MHAHLHDIKAGQHITVIYRQQFESHLLVGSYVARAHDTIVVACEDSGRVIQIPVCDVVSVRRDLTG